MKSYLDALGVFGYSYPKERAFHAAVLTGTPILLISTHGEAKTLAAMSIAWLLFGDPLPGELSLFQKIDASKAQFEDMVGFPNPKAYEEGEMSYIETPNTLWKKQFVLIDEISRCNPAMMSKFLEIVLDRELMGIPTDIRWVWATMNPLTYPGSNPLDGALAGRFGYVIQVDPIVKAHETILQQVINSRSRAQTPALGYWLGEERDYKRLISEEMRTQYRKMIDTAAHILAGLDDHWSAQVSRYLAAFAKLVDGAGMIIDGRRLVMMRYNIISNIAIDTAMRGRGLKPEEVKQLAKEVVLMSIPWQATGIKDGFDATKLTAAHTQVAEFLTAGEGLLYRIITEQDPLEKVMIMLDNRQAINPAEATSLIASIYEPYNTLGEPAEVLREMARRFAIKVGLSQLFLSMDEIPSEVIAIVAKGNPISFVRTGATPTSAYLSNYRESTAIADYYLQFAAGNSTIDTAAAYFAFHTDAGPFTLEELRQRVTVAREELRAVAKKFKPYLPLKVKFHVSSGYDDSADEGDEAQDVGTAAAGTARAPVSTDSRRRLVAI